MKNNKIFIIIIGALLVILIGLGILIGVTQNRKNQSSDSHSGAINNKETDTEYNLTLNYVCEMEQDSDTSDFKIISQENLVVENNLIKENVKSTKMIFNNSALYKVYKENSSSQTNLKFDDDNLTVIDNSNTDNTEDEENTSIPYEEYQVFLESIGYTCKRES